jgi:regulator of RNase E activity RraB
MNEPISVSVKPAAGQKHFDSIGEVEAFADLIAVQRQEVMALSDEAQGIYRLRYPEEE